MCVTIIMRIKVINSDQRSLAATMVVYKVQIRRFLELRNMLIWVRKAKHCLNKLVLSEPTLFIFDKARSGALVGTASTEMVGLHLISVTKVILK